MRRWLSASIIAMMMLLGGCATSVVRSDVTVFHEWPGEMREKVYAFERTREQDNDLEYRSYENLVRAELVRLGFAEASATQPATLKVTLSYGLRGRDVRVIEGAITDQFWYGAPVYGHRWVGRGYFGPYYDPFWPVAPTTQYAENTYQIYTRQLKIKIARIPSGKTLYDATVVSEGTTASLAAVMPYMVRSAFVDFPGASGVPRHVDLKMTQ
jgi:hypothetical protein